MSELDFRTLPNWMPDALEIMALVETWAKAYEVPREAIIRQIPIAYAWAQSNKKKAPRKNVVRFLFSWMKQAKKWGNLRVPEVKKPKVEEQANYDMSVEEMIAIRKANMQRSAGL